MNGLLLMVLLIGANASVKPELKVALKETFVLKVSDRTKSADQLIAAAEKLGGYFSSRDDDSVTFKIPAAQLKSLTAKVAPLGVVVEHTSEAEDVASTMLEQRTLLKSREQVLQRYFGVLDAAGIGSVVEVESEMTSLVQQIEELKGALQLLEHRVQLAEVVVQFQFRDRRAPGQTGESSFAWLNTVNLASLLEEFADAR